MTCQEERLVLELHAKWGNRWSKIAQKLPGRTDNEIKNFWRTHMRKKAQEKKHLASPTSSSSNCSTSTLTTFTTQDSLQSPDSGRASFYDTGGPDGKLNHQEVEDCEGYSMDDIWKEIDQSESNIIKPVRDVYAEQSYYFNCPLLALPAWESSLDSTWNMEAVESKLFFATDHFPFCSDYTRSSSFTN